MKRLSMMLQRPIVDGGIALDGITKNEIEECLKRLKYQQHWLRKNCWVKGNETLCIGHDDYIRPLGL